MINYKHLIGLPIQTLTDVKPVLLIGRGPAAIHTKLGWTLQGPASVVCHLTQPQQCLFTTVAPQVSELMKHVERLWQVDMVPFRSEKLATRSKQDQAAISILETKTTRVEVDGILRYATPLLRRKDMPLLQATKEAVMPTLRGVERRLAKDPARAVAYKVEMEKLIKAGSVIKCGPEAPADEGCESWYIPHHMVSHNGKNRLVFNCSYQYQGQSLNDYLLPGPTLGASLLGVLLRFREHAVAISGDIKGMFHQVRLLPEDRALLRFVWRDVSRGGPPEAYEWQVLPFGMTCSPCCATFAVQRQINDHSQPDADVRMSVERCFYVDNCLQSVPTITEARHLVDKLQTLLASAGFELRQWASNKPEVIGHLLEESRSASVELWLAQDKTDAPESTLGLSWLFHIDVLGYKHRQVDYVSMTLWGSSCPTPPGLRYWSGTFGTSTRAGTTHYCPRSFCSIFKERYTYFCDASEEAYGSVAYLRSTDRHGGVHLSFLMARSRVAPKRYHSIPRLELCAALTGAQLAQVLRRELTLNIDQMILWSDSMTVLTWLKSESCRFKVFVGTRVAEIQELTEGHLYVPSLKVRQKWQASPADIVQDCVVMIADPQLPWALWPIGRVIKTHLSPDGHIWSADVKVRERVYTRPVARLVVLPALPSGDDEDKSLSTTLSQP
ncbi:hypothetical protein N1851_029617 [Merluccius polli]|uniref:ribonuclease H n=1 Tax=Merluccius polli TaxID=89951 RepID=A0AA47M6U0_MERPO|nr:hypothetical protein N1851_029617 [Merluccius polli]